MRQLAHMTVIYDSNTSYNNTVKRDVNDINITYEATEQKLPPIVPLVLMLQLPLRV